MKTPPAQILQDLLINVDEILSDDDIKPANLSNAIEFTVKAIEATKQYILQHPFTNIEEEITFFKKIKPELDGRLIFFFRLASIIFKEPVTGNSTIIQYYQSQLEQINQYFTENREFYIYYRMGHTHLDHTYFSRNINTSHLHTDNFYWMMDRQTNSPMSIPLAIIRANELSASFIIHRIWLLSQQQGSASDIKSESSQITWTGSKSALVELIVALQEHGVFNSTRVPLKRLADYFSKVFNIKLGNIFKIHEDNRLRKKGRKPFLDALSASYIRRLEFEDENSP